MLTNYLPMLLFIGVGLFIGVAPMVLGSLISPRKPTAEKLSAYECGFPAFEDARLPFDVRYYLVAILFILFDVDIVFLYPWAVVYSALGYSGLVQMGLFLGILMVGFVYVWDNGALDWR